MNKIFFPRKKVYFEKQKNDRLCGLHAINSLMQGPYFDLGQLTEIGINLNEMEREIMQNNTNENVDDDGNYNVQVLTAALKIYNVELLQINTKKLITMVNENVEAILFNSSTHWFSIRKIDDIWFNLNSTNELPGPEIISDFYLGAFIQGTVDAGYTNFLVKNLPLLPAVNNEMYKNLNDEKKFVPIEEITEAKERKNFEMKEKKNEKNEKEGNNKNKFEAFKGKGISMNDDQFEQFDNNELDEETRLAIEMSMNEFVGEMEKKVKKEPSEDEPSIYTIIFQAEGQSFQRRFYPGDTFGVIFTNSF